MPYTDVSSLGGYIHDDMLASWRSSFEHEFVNFMKKIELDTTKCYFCKKKLGIKYKTIKSKDETFKICNNCEYLYKVINNEKKSKNLKAVRQIITFMITNGDDNK